MSKKKIKLARAIVKRCFKNSKGQPYIMTDGECKLFASYIDQSIHWLWTSAPTRYGKTEIAALALIYLAVYRNLKIPVVAGSMDKADKIMEYIVQHLPDHPDLYYGLINLNLTTIEKLKLTVSKEALRWATGGWIYVTSVDSRNLSKEGEGVVGEGGDIVFLEEAGLIKNREQFSKIVRMPEADRGWGKLIMNGNCVEKSVFEDAFNDPMFTKVRITLDQAIAEKRFTKTYLAEKKRHTTKKDWKRYYLVEFPAANEFTYFKPDKYEYIPKDCLFFGALDPALGKTKAADLVGIVVLGVSKKTGQKYEAYSSGRVMKPEETIREIFNLPFTFQRFGIEAVMFQSYFLDEITRRSKEEERYIPFEAMKQSKKKEERIESLEPDVDTGQILFIGDNELWNELQDWPEPDKDDVLDALEMANRLSNEKRLEFVISQ